MHFYNRNEYMLEYQMDHLKKGYREASGFKNTDFDSSYSERSFEAGHDIFLCFSKNYSHVVIDICIVELEDTIQIRIMYMFESLL